MRRLPLALPISSAILWLSACDRARSVYVPVAPGNPATAIRIGTFGARTGNDARTGLAEARGFGLAIEACNAGGGVNGRPIVVVDYDDQGRPAAANVAADRLARLDRVDLIVGGTSLERAREAAGAAGPVVFACAACAGEPASDPDGVVGLAPGPRERAEIVAEEAVRARGARTIAILARAGSDADRERAEALRTSLHARGVEAGEPVAVSSGTIEAQLNALADSAPQAVCIAFDGGDAVRLGLALRRRGIPASLSCFGTPDLDILPPADRPTALEGLCFPAAFDASAVNDPRAEFNARFRARYASEPTENALAGFAAAERVIAALGRTPGPTATDLRAALRAVPGRFPLLLMRVERGRLVRASAPRN